MEYFPEFVEIATIDYFINGKLEGKKDCCNKLENTNDGTKYEKNKNFLN